VEEIKTVLITFALFFFFQQALARGAKGVSEPWEESDEFGTVTFASVQTVRSSTSFPDHVGWMGMRLQ